MSDRSTTTSPTAPSLELVQLLVDLRSAVVLYAQGRRAAGVAMERVIPELEGLVREAMSSEGSLDSADALMARVVHWTIAAYDDDPETAPLPRAP